MNTFNTEKVVDCLTKVIKSIDTEKKPEPAEIKWQIEMEAMNLIQENLIEEAIFLFDLILDPFASGTAILNRAKSYRILGQYEKALYDLNRLADSVADDNYLISMPLYLERVLVNERLQQRANMLKDIVKFISIIGKHKDKISFSNRDDNLDAKVAKFGEPPSLVFSMTGKICSIVSEEQKISE